MNGMENPEGFELPAVQPVAPERQTPSDPAREHEIRRGVIDKMSREDAEEKARLERIDEIIRNRKN